MYGATAPPGHAAAVPIDDAVDWLVDTAPSQHRLDPGSTRSLVTIRLARIVCERPQSDLDAAQEVRPSLSQWAAAGLPEEAHAAALEMLQR